MFGNKFETNWLKNLEIYLRKTNIYKIKLCLPNNTLMF